MTPVFVFFYKTICTFRNAKTSPIITSKCVFQEIKNTHITCEIKRYSILIYIETRQK